MIALSTFFSSSPQTGSLTRLWCALELFVYVSMVAQDSTRMAPTVMLLGEDAASQSEVQAAWRNFDVRSCSCFHGFYCFVSPFVRSMSPKLNLNKMLHRFVLLLQVPSLPWVPFGCELGPTDARPERTHYSPSQLRPVTIQNQEPKLQISEMLS